MSDVQTKVFEPTPELTDLLIRSGSAKKEVSVAASAEFAKALEQPLRQGVLSGNILNGIFEPVRLAPGATPEFPLDFLAPGTEKDFVAYTIPNHGYIPERHVESDYVMVPTYDVGASIDYLLKYARDARWDVVGRAMEVLESSFVKKMNDDGWHTVISAGVDRNIVVFDGDAAAGQFTKRLVSLMKTVMRRNGGGNSTATTAVSLLIFMSHQRLWKIFVTGVLIKLMRLLVVKFTSDDGGASVNRVFGVNLHDLDELGVDQEYQLFYSSTLSGSLGSDQELVVGLDLRKRDSFIMPIREEVQIFEDDTFIVRRELVSMDMPNRFSQYDNRRVLLGTL